MNQKVIVLWKAPNVAVARRGPRVLENLDREGKTQFYTPRMDAAGNILYELDEEYARRLLAGQGDRFFLVSPPELVIKRRKADNMSAEYVNLKAITALTQAPAPAGNPPAGAQEAVSSSSTPEGTAPPAETAATGSETGQAGAQEAAPDLRHAQQASNGPKKPKATAA